MAAPVPISGRSAEALLSAHVAEAASTDSAGITRFEYAVTACEMVADLIAVVIAALFSYAVYRHFQLGKHLQYGTREDIAMVIGFAVFFVLMLDRDGAYYRGNSLLRVKETERVLRVSALTFVLICPVTFFANFYFSRWLLVIGVVVVPLFVAIEKHATYLAVRKLHAKGYGVRKVIIYGAGQTGRKVYSALARSPKLGLSPVALVDDDSSRLKPAVFELGYQHRSSAPVLQGPPTKELLEAYGATRLVIAIPSLSRQMFIKAISEAFAAGAKVSFVPSHNMPGGGSLHHVDIDGLLLSSVDQINSRPGYEFMKRLLDVSLAILLLSVLAPMLIVIAILVRYDSPGPSLFVQKRIGRHGRPFHLYKFRTMYVNTPAYEYCPKDSDDRRITPIGKFLRKTSLDELPQLINVVKGEMSLVGPRPEMPFIVERYTTQHRERLSVKPGLTGLWQLSADRAYLIHDNMEYDTYYIRNRNVFMDVAILIHTMFFAMRGV